MIELVFTAYFLVQVVERESDTSKTYNILLEQDQGRGRAHNLVAHWTEDPTEFKEGEVVLLRVHGECTQVYEVHEGHGKRGSPWRAEDDWFLVGRPYICNATKVEKL